MDYVYFVRHGDNEELRYSIRSLVKNAPEGDVWVIGHKPDWYVGNFISIKDKYQKFGNILNCCSVAAHSADISEDFVWMNDDFFIVKEVKEILPLHRGTLADRVASYSGNSINKYQRLIIETYKKLVSIGYDNPLDYETHIPLRMNKEDLRIALRHGLLPRSIYGNMFNIGGDMVRDVKVYGSKSDQHRTYDYLSGDSPYLSTEDFSFKEVLDNVLGDMFPEPSQYELI
jgi:hypothetical protein